MPTKLERVALLSENHFFLVVPLGSLLSVQRYLPRQA
jgi:hypothetical protein